MIYREYGNKHGIYRNNSVQKLKIHRYVLLYWGKSFPSLDESRRRAQPGARMMLRKLSTALSSALAAIFTGPAAANPKIACFHCGELVRQKRVVSVVFDGVCRDVCCHGCAAILATVEQLGQTGPYLAQKRQSEISADA